MDRFWSKVEKTDSCWNWKACRAYRHSTGVPAYGQFKIGRKIHAAHRVAWELANGPIPEGLFVLHLCDNQACVRPSHLYLGTHADNTRDAMERHRMHHGDRVWNHKLAEYEISHIRRLIGEGMPTEDIGRVYGVSGRTIRYIRSGERWREA